VVDSFFLGGIMQKPLTRRDFLGSTIAAGSAALAGKRPPAAAGKRDMVMDILKKDGPHDYFPAAFFIHFDEKSRLGEPAVARHLEFFRATGMDFVKIQYEREFPRLTAIKNAQDWKSMPLYKRDFYEPELQVVRGLVKAAKKDALILVTLYSPFMCAGHTAGLSELTSHLNEDPEAVKKGLEIITESLMIFVKECIRIGVDGFYASTQGGEATRFKTAKTFSDSVKPHDLVLMKEINRTCPFNILHICDYNGPYADFAPYLDYPGHVVNCNPRLTTGTLSWKEVQQMFKRPVMGGMDRHGIMVKGSSEQIRQEVATVLKDAPWPFILGADCTLPGDISWENIRAAIGAAHSFQA
jgi:uroporphyrinogen decarboxylase